jgi:predicted nucleic acid-binding protein
LSRTKAVTPDILLDTSVAVAVCVADHVGHAAAVEAIGSRTIGLAGHAWFETFSVLTRLPPPQRRSAPEVIAMMRQNFASGGLASAAAHQRLVNELDDVGISGGAIYDALVAVAAREVGRPLLSSDRRAATTYARLGVDVEFVES